MRTDYNKIDSNINSILQKYQTNTDRFQPQTSLEGNFHKQEILINQDALFETQNRVNLNIENIDSYSDDASNLLLNDFQYNRQNS